MQSIQQSRNTLSSAALISHISPRPCLIGSCSAHGPLLAATPRTCAAPRQSLVFRLQLACLQQTGQRRNAQGRVAAAAGPDSRTSQAPDTVTSLYDALNARDIAAAGACLAADMSYENLAIQDSLTGQSAVAKFYADSLAAVPREATFQLEQVTSVVGSTATVIWRLVLASNQALLSRGIALYTLQPGSGLISNVTECHEHPVKLSYSQLLLVRPLVAGLAWPLPAVLPAVQEVSRGLQQGFDSLLQPLASLASPPSSNGFGSYSSGSSSSNGSTFSSTTFSSNSGSSSPNPFAVAAPSAAARSQIQPMRQTAAAAAAAVGEAAGSSVKQRAAARVAAAKAQRLYTAGAGAGAGMHSSSQAAAGSGDTGMQTGAAAAEPVDFSGLWVKDAARSDLSGYEASLDVLGLSGMQKVTARLIEGVEIQQTASKFTVSFVTVVPFFKVTEEVPLNSGSVQQRRRDLRQGQQTAAARTVSSPEQQGVLVEMSWGAPLQGTLTELYSLLPDGCLAVTAETRVGAKQARSLTVYRRSAGSREAMLADSRRRNSSVADVLRQQQGQGLST